MNSNNDDLERIESTLYNLSIEAGKAELEYSKADSNYESAKKLLDSYLAEFIRNAPGDSATAKKQSALANSEYIKKVKDLNELLKEKNMTRAIRNGAVSRWDSVRSIMSYRKTQIDKGIITN